MRLPRVHFSVLTLLILVAMIAVTCGALRWLVERNQHSPALSAGFLPLETGSLPLFDAVLFGAVLHAETRLASRPRAGAARVRTWPAAFVFLSAHFFLLLVLARLVELETASRYLESLWNVRYLALKGWESLTGDSSSGASSIVEGAWACLFVSGPPLLFALVGSLLATRCARSLPRHRFKALTFLTSFAFVSAGLAICMSPQPFHEEQPVLVGFQVVDEDSGRPIASASLGVIDPFFLHSTLVESQSLTDAQGQSRLTCRFVVSGERNAFQSMARFVPKERWLEVSAAGHRTRRLALSEALGSFVDTAPPRICKVTLARGERPKDAFAHLAGFYSTGGGFGGHWIKIESDGRFAWMEWGCTFHESEIGYVQPHEGFVKLVPIAHPGRETHADSRLKYHVIEWGNWRFFCEPKDFAYLCREALTPLRPPYTYAMYRVPARNLDREKRRSRPLDFDEPPKGLPQLPLTAWAEFVIGELSVRNEEGMLRVALDLLVSHIPWRGLFWARAQDDRLALGQIGLVPEPLLARGAPF